MLDYLFVLAAIITILVLIFTYIYGSNAPNPQQLPETPQKPTTIENKSEEPSMKTPEAVSSETGSSPKEPEKDDVKPLRPAETADDMLADMLLLPPHRSGSVGSISAPVEVIPPSPGIVTEPVIAQPHSVGGYRTMGSYSGDIDKSGLKMQMNKAGKYSYLVGANYHASEKSLAEQGMGLRVIYVGLKKVLTDAKEDPKVVGVRIRDPVSGASSPGSWVAPSQLATITEVIDVGGIDKYGYGTIRL